MGQKWDKWDKWDEWDKNMGTKMGHYGEAAKNTMVGITKQTHGRMHAKFNVDYYTSTYIMTKSAHIK